MKNIILLQHLSLKIVVKENFPRASAVGSDRIVLRIKGNDYRLIVKINYDFETIFIKFIGTHEAPDPIEAIKFRMDQMGMSISDLGEVLGYRSRASEILSRKRKLTLAMMRRVHEKLGIPAEVLIQDY